MKKPLLIAITFVLSCQIGFAQRQSCTEAEEQKAEREASTVRSWNALYHSFRRYANCDDGAVAEGYDDSVAQLLLNRWDALPQLDALAAKDKRFKAFVLRHVSVTAIDAKRLEKLTVKATQHCSITKMAICGDIRHTLNELSHN